MELKQILESLLLVAEKPVSLEELCVTLEQDKETVLEALNDLTEEFSSKGINIICSNDEFEMVSSPKNANWVMRFLNQELKNDLAQSALEVLAIILYKQPITRGEIEQIRGVNSDQSVRNLLIRGLIEEKGRKDTPGKPILFGTSINLLKHFGFSSKEDIPKLEEITND
ncbi:TPA: SMC-Scp complex subunit ScpB [candidate division CPR2 bacterium]|uniref:Segregation and condensation protein B n=1 Tax=candidate division CPR2 bacterium GW2011_GWC1_41_48 TaxID=1618344 RepID=A0A0G0YJW8_UNCC2|nr:MAG: Segregation and condensation protein B [candidate division CPR2 bacterium GW2011_GWC2_39_35]KKR28005.1 MAG: Segregation and condensation protein B [candidate division CPR2 bacterium GW2011_GWD2_39_7]KKS09836.1 MAG: Segregation and condensation protein B [candidate division CPR2 bacterium GW2011_GWC1_41_48]OGB72100.1 MAG: SMC-Scp complex subunit ScpB [candidate division CPR2 bacterium GWD2_39_7]HBG81629.1 SMC-Scp complex subunit ScpB [candidate division CPR2 bacterium]